MKKEQEKPESEAEILAANGSHDINEGSLLNDEASHAYCHDDQSK